MGEHVAAQGHFPQGQIVVTRPCSRTWLAAGRGSQDKNLSLGLGQMGEFVRTAFKG